MKFYGCRIDDVYPVASEEELPDCASMLLKTYKEGLSGIFLNQRLS